MELIPIVEPEFTKVRINENPLLKVPPASRGNRTGAPLAVPLAKRGEPKGGGGIYELWIGDWYYLPCVLSLDTVEAFLGAGLGWLYHYNYERVHSGYGMAGRTPYGCCVALGFEGSAYVGLMPVVLLDDIVLDWSREGVPAVNDVLAHYTRGQGVGGFCRASDGYNSDAGGV
jgi:hypothetical protein